MAKKSEETQAQQADAAAAARVYPSLQPGDPAELDAADILHDLERAFHAAEGALGEARQLFGVLQTKMSLLTS